MTTPLMRSINVTTEYAAIAVINDTTSCTLSCPATNSGVVWFKGDDNSDVPWQPGEWHKFSLVNLASVEIKGAVGDIVTVIGGTW